MQITIVGCGNMGLIYARAFLKYDITKRENLLLVEKNENRQAELKKLDIGNVVLPDDPIISKSDLVILAVKPQDFNELGAALKKVMKPNIILLSIMAGIQIKKIETILDHKNIIRAMPNSPVELGMGITGFSASAGISLDHLRKAENLLSTTGRTVFFEDEGMLDAVTALSGSGPAYFFYLVKNMVDAGKQMGFDEGVSAMLVKQTMLGAFHLLNSSNKSLDELITAVASKGGTTEAALKVFEANGVGKHLAEGIVQAEKRAKELSK